MRKIEESGGRSGIYTEYNPENHELKIDSKAPEFEETREIIKKVGKEGHLNYTTHLARLCFEYTELKKRVQGRVVNLETYDTM